MGILLEDWYVAFADVTDDQLREAGRAWCDKPRDVKGFKPWPITADLREMLKARTQDGERAQLPGCPDCDFTGWRSILRIEIKRNHLGQEYAARTQFNAPCDCPKGARLTNPPPRPANYAGPNWEPLQPFHVVASAWEAKGCEVHVTDQTMPAFPLSLTNPDAWAKAQKGQGAKGSGFMRAAEKLMRGATPNARDVRREEPDHAQRAAGDYDPDPTADPDGWRRSTL